MVTTTAVDADALLTDLGALEPPSKAGHVCQAGHALAQLPPEVRVQVEAILDNRRDVPATTICQVLSRHGIQVRAANLARHRRRGAYNGCQCPRSSGDTA